MMENTNENLLENLQRAYDYVSAINKKAESIMAMEEQKVQLVKTHASKCAYRKWVKAYWVWFGILVSIGLIFLIVFSCELEIDYWREVVSDGDIGEIFVAMLFTVLPIGVGLLMAFFAIRAKRYNTKQDKIDAARWLEEVVAPSQQIDEQIAAVRKEIREYTWDHQEAVAFLPSKYQSYYSVSHLLTYVRDCRADTLKEALNLLEADLERKKQTKKDRQMMDMLASIISEQERTTDAVEAMEYRQR